MTTTIFPDRGDTLAVMLASKIDQATIEKIETPINPALLKDRPSFQKFGGKQYLPVPSMIRHLNDIFNYQWSFEVVSEEYMPFDEDRAFIKIKGRLSIPGVGIKEQYGTGEIDLKGGTNKNKGVAFTSYQFAYNKASTYAFKSCYEMTGLGQSTGETWDEPLYVETEEEAPATKPAKPIEKPADKPNYTQEQINRMLSFKQEFNITTNQELIPILKMWDMKITTYKDINPGNIDQFLDWAETNAAKLSAML